MSIIELGMSIVEIKLPWHNRDFSEQSIGA